MQPTIARTWRLDDASVLAASYPYTFYKPSAQAIALLKAGNLAKLVFIFDSLDPSVPRAERMWVRIDRVEGQRFQGVLDNEPRHIPDLKADDPIEFEARHIIDVDIDDPVPDPTAPYVMRCFVTRRVLDDGVPVGYLYREAPDGDEDSGWRIFSGEESDDYVNDPQNIAIVSLGAVLGKDDSFRHLLESIAPCAYMRDQETSVFEAVEPPSGG